MHVSSTVGELVKCADVCKQIYMARDMTIVHVCNIVANMHGLFTMTKASNVCHYHLCM